MDKTFKFRAINKKQKVYKASWNDAHDKLKVWFEGSPHKTMTLHEDIVKRVKIEWVGV